MRKAEKKKKCLCRTSLYKSGLFYGNAPGNFAIDKVYAAKQKIIENVSFS